MSFASALKQMKNITSDIKKNTVIELDITDMNNLGAGVSHLPDGRVIFVIGSVVGDRVRAKVIKVNSTYAVARTEEVLKSSLHRARETFCTAPHSCGGCVYRELDYEYERELKESYVRHAFIKAGIPDAVIEPLRTTGRIRAYRNKAQYPFAKAKSGTVAGFYAAKTHNVVPAADCALQPEIFGRIVREICALADRFGLEVYDETERCGLLRHLYLRLAEATGQVMLCLVINGRALPHADEIVASIRAAFPEIASIQLNINTESTNVVLGREYKLLYGERYIEDVLCGVRFRITPESFYQVNHDGAELLYSLARERALEGTDGNTCLVDMYCGTGTIGLSMADSLTSLVGIEIVDGAVECARENARINGFENAEFYASDAGNIEKIFASVEENRGALKPDAVVLDPPRKGCSREVIEFLASRKIPRIVYVSCDPDTLARDCKLFSDLGYAIGTVTPVDMFPRTGHVECVCLLTRENAI